MNYKVEQIALMTANHKLVPFLGAGCSRAILNCDWDSIVNVMKKEVHSSKNNNIDIAQDYVDKLGKDQLCELLKSHLLINDFNTEKGYNHIAIMCSGIGVIYTTNQDNVMEKCLEYYGRRFSAIVDLEDLVSSNPGECLYFKFHGDLQKPDSVIFTRRDYDQRMDKATEHFLDIRLKSDMLGKNLLFLGYSFRDDNLKQIFEEMKKAFEGELPKSYLVSFAYSDDLKQVCEEYGIEIIVPKELYPTLSNTDAFEKFLYDWNIETFKQRNSEDIQQFFNPKSPVVTRVISPFEVRLMKEALTDMTIGEAIEKFRACIDGTLIPDALEKDVAQMFFNLCERCETEEESNEIGGASFNLHIKDNELRYEQLVHIVALANLYKKKEGLNLYYPAFPGGFPDEIGVFIGSNAISLLQKWKRPISEYFQETLSHLADYSIPYDAYGEEIAAQVKEQYDYAWGFQTTLEHPLKRQKRIGQLHRSRNYKDILGDMMSKLPKEFTRPFES